MKQKIGLFFAYCFFVPFAIFIFGCVLVAEGFERMRRALYRYVAKS